MTCRPSPERRQLQNCKNILFDSNQENLPSPQYPYLQRQLSNGIKQPMNTVEACTIIDNTINSLSRSLNMFAEKNNRPMLSSSPTSAHPQAHNIPATSEPTVEPTENSSIVIEAYKDETQMPCIMSVITKELSEPYSIYTYRFFIHNWPELCLLARDTTNNCNIGVIVCKLDHDVKWRRGYIAMLAVEQAYRRRGIGKMLVQRSIEVMREKGCDEVMLEAEVTNKSALILYDRLGFIRERRLYRYYLNGSDAFRLKLLFADCWPEERPLLRDLECDDQCDHDHQHSHQPQQQHQITEVA
uniref:N-acetyltransferase domain-containing protein n=1 Tax=Panagrolaimus superbus TaxID=310955 RepID=A0A914YRF0_9BILA